MQRGQPVRASRRAWNVRFYEGKRRVTRRLENGAPLSKEVLRANFLEKK
jgi:hypothetical protein